MAEDQDDSQKTEEPSAKKLEEARSKGQVASSKEVNNWAILLTATLILTAFAPYTAATISSSLRVFVEKAHAIEVGPGGVGNVVGAVFAEMLLVLLGPMVLIMLAGAAASVAQTGLLFTAEPMKPDLSKLSPLAGVKRLFSLKQMVEFLKGILKILIVGGMAAWVLSPVFESIEHFAMIDILDTAGELRSILLQLMFTVLMAVTVLAVADVAYQRYEHHQKMKMSKQEVKEEYKQTEGDPHVKARLRQLRAEKARRRMMAEVPKADVVVTNPTHFAVALKYDPDKHGAPMVTAKGQDLIALKIREVAGEHEVPIVENPPLARALHAACDIDQEIPPDHYKAVAEVISYVFGLKGRRIEKPSDSPATPTGAAAG